MAKQDSFWAPWYYYVFVLALGHAIAQFAVLNRVDQVTNAIASIVLTVVLMVAVSLGWRATRKNRV